MKFSKRSQTETEAARKPAALSNGDIMPGERETGKSIEEMVQAIKDGQTEYIEPLWMQLQGFIYTVAKRYLQRARMMCYDMEDLMQESFFALAPAIEKYDPDRGAKFQTHLFFFIRTTLGNMLHLRAGKDLHEETFSLDASVLNEDGEETDFLSFMAAPDNIENLVLDRLEREEVKALVLKTLEPETAALILEYFSAERPSVSLLADRHGVKWHAMQGKISRALRDLRRAAYRQGLVVRRTPRVYLYWGASPTEESALRNIEREEKRKLSPPPFESVLEYLDNRER